MEVSAVAGARTRLATGLSDKTQIRPTLVMDAEVLAGIGAGAATQHSLGSDLSDVYDEILENS